MKPIPAVPSPWSELVDKITILEIKMEKISDQTAQENIKLEHSLLSEIIERSDIQASNFFSLREKLKKVNETLWNIEDDIRRKESIQEFDEEFISLARSVYKVNDERSKLKREINIALKSKLIEEKKYVKY